MSLNSRRTINSLLCCMFHEGSECGNRRSNDTAYQIYITQASSRILNWEDFASQKFECVIHHLHDENCGANVTLNIVGWIPMLSFEANCTHQFQWQWSCLLYAFIAFNNLFEVFIRLVRRTVKILKSDYSKPFHA